MEKALLIILFTLSCRIASVQNQFCRQLPLESQIVTEFDSQLGEAVDQSFTREVSYNCIAVRMMGRAEASKRHRSP